VPLRPGSPPRSLVRAAQNTPLAATGFIEPFLASGCETSARRLGARTILPINDDAPRQSRLGIRLGVDLDAGSRARTPPQARSQARRPSSSQSGSLARERRTSKVQVVPETPNTARPRSRPECGLPGPSRRAPKTLAKLASLTPSAWEPVERDVTEPPRHPSVALRSSHAAGAPRYALPPARG
jgi:hypothetical protein